jgi:hypothetical protein
MTEIERVAAALRLSALHWHAQRGEHRGFAIATAGDSCTVSAAARLLGEYAVVQSVTDRWALSDRRRFALRLAAVEEIVEKQLLPTGNEALLNFMATLLQDLRTLNHVLEHSPVPNAEVVAAEPSADEDVTIDAAHHCWHPLQVTRSTPGLAGATNEREESCCRHPHCYRWVDVHAVGQRQLGSAHGPY